MAVTKVEMPPPHLNAADSLTSGGLGGGGTASSGASNTAPSNTSGNSISNNNNNNNNTISAPADSSDNQPSTPQPAGANNEQQQKQQLNQHTQLQQQQQSHHPYAAAHHMYVPPSSATTTTTTNVDQMPSHMYCSGMYSSVAAAGNGGGGGNNLQQQQAGSMLGYPNYLNNYETTTAATYYHHHQQQQQSSTAPVAPTTLSSLDYSNIGGGSSSTSSPTNQLLFGDYKSPQSTLRYHPYLNNPTSLLQGNSNTVSTANGSVGRANLNNSHTSDSSQTQLRSVDEQSNAVASAVINASAVSTTSLSPRIVSSSSPSSTSQQQHSGSPSCPQFQCKKCGFVCSNDTELTAHITNVHGGSNSPYSSSNAGMSTNFTNGPPHTTQQSSSGSNPGELLDLDSQKMVYPPTPVANANAGGDDYQQQMHSAISTDPLHSMHSMERRQLSGWEHTQQPQHQQQQQQETLSPYLQNEQKIATTVTSNQAHNIQSPYYSPKQSPYPIKSEYPIIKSEYALDSQNYVDKSFEPNATSEISCQQQQQSLLPLPSSPAEFPSTTTTPQPDQQQAQQQQYGGSQFEPPTSSSVLPASGVTTKSAAWKSNEARRPKTYNCTACNKWFTSSGHLKRHYNTTLHKNAVKSSGQPDPATMPISAHHHPARDPSSKSNRRSKAEAAAAAREQQQQQATAQSLQPPEPATSPPDYAPAPPGAAGLTALSHYSASPSPTQLTNQANNLSYAQQQQQPQNGASGHPFQQQYLQQMQSSTNNSTVLNGHPNGLAGPSVHQQQTPLMSSQMRGLLNSTITTIVTKSEPLMEDQQPQPQLRQQHSPMGMEMEGMSVDQQHLHPPGLQRISGMGQLLDHQQAYRLELQRQYHNSTPSSTHSSILTQSPPPLIISHQQYLEQLQQPQQQLEDNTFCRTPPTPDSIHMQQQQQQQHNIIVEQQQQPFSITVLDTSTIQQQQQPLQQHSSSNMSPPLQRTITTATISNMDNIHIMQPPPGPNQEQQQQPQAHIMSSTLLNNTSNTLEQQQSQQLQLQPPPLATIRNTTIHTTPTITHNTIRIPSFQQLQQQAALSVPAVLGTEATMSYHTIIGNSNDQFAPSTDEQFFEHYTTQMLTPDGQLLQLIPTQQLLNQSLYRMGTVTQSYAPSTPYTAHRSPQEADLPPANDHIQTHESSGAAMESGGDGADSVLPMTYSSLSPETNCSQDINKNNTNKMILIQMEPNMITSLTNVTSSTKPIIKQQQIKRNGTASNKRKRNDCGGAGGGNDGKLLGELTPNGRIKCQQCDKTFTKTCYLTQHINCFHAGEYPFRCEKCGKRFQQEEAFEIHVERHQASEKAFKCHLCPKHYHHKTDLRRHIEGTHLNRKLHVCDICEKSFCRFDHLQKHISTHTRTRIPGKRSANKMKSKNENDHAEPKAKKLVGNCIDHVASSIDSVVNNNCSDDSSDSNNTKSNSNMNNNSNTNEVNLEKNIDSIDQKIVIKLEDQEFLTENGNNHDNRILLSSPALSTPYIIPHEKILVKQEYQMIEPEIPIC